MDSLMKIMTIPARYWTARRRWLIGEPCCSRGDGELHLLGHYPKPSRRSMADPNHGVCPTEVEC
jgi:hypothetical protein